tara:strand:+ start:388 stop:738 length:351 start_codon:yes stop_codon:yes gene_type:complete
LKKKILCFDLDNVICDTKKNLYKLSKPKKKVIAYINYLYDQGYIIKIFTARFMGRTNDNRIKATRSGKNFTIKQLKKWNLKYHKLFFGKPSFDVFVDDKSFGFKKNWLKSFSKIFK